MNSLAIRLMKLASLLGQAEVELLELLEKGGPGCQCIQDEKDVFEKFEDGVEVTRHALRVLAMRFDRAAVANTLEINFKNL